MILNPWWLQSELSMLTQHKLFRLTQQNKMWVFKRQPYVLTWSWPNRREFLTKSSLSNAQFIRFHFFIIFLQVFIIFFITFLILGDVFKLVRVSPIPISCTSVFVSSFKFMWSHLRILYVRGFTWRRENYIKVWDKPYVTILC